MRRPRTPAARRFRWKSRSIGSGPQRKAESRDGSAPTSARRPVWTDVHDYDGSAAFHAPFLEAASYVFMNRDGLGNPLELMRATVAHGAQVTSATSTA